MAQHGPFQATPAMIASPPPVAARPQIAGVHDASLRWPVAWRSPHLAKAQIVGVSQYLWRKVMLHDCLAQE